MNNDDFDILLKEFDRVIHTGAKSDEEIISLAKKCFINNSYNNYNKACEDLSKVIKIKKKFNEFKFLCSKDNKSSFDSSTIICIKDNEFIFNHELQHLLHYYYQGREMPDEMEYMLPDIIVEPLMKYYAKELEQLLNSKLKSEEYYKNKYNECNKEYDEYKYLLFKADCIKHDIPEYLGLQDIIDAYTMGYLDEYYMNNESIYHLCTHGKEYYSKGKDIMFAEIYANYVALLKSKNGYEYIELLKELLGEEFITCLDKFYNGKNKVK